MTPVDTQHIASDELQYDVASAAMKGANDYQQDSFISCFPLGQTHGFTVIADGMGGSFGGEVASAIASAELYAHLKLHAGDIEASNPNLPLILREGAESANGRIAAHVQHDPATKGMGTTLLAPVISGTHLSWVSVGDSPMLLFRDGALRRLNKDHSMAPQIDAMVKIGTLDPDVGRDHPDRHSLTSVLDGNEIEKIDCPAAPVSLRAGDIIVAASDGLLSLSNATIANILALGEQRSSQDTANAFLQALEALNAPDQDNMTLCVIKVGLRRAVGMEIDADEMPVLAVANGPQSPRSVPLSVGQPLQSPGTVSQPKSFEEEVPPAVAAKENKKKYYYYRGQRYERED